MMTMENTIQTKLVQALRPSHMRIVNQSHLHQGHAGDNGSGESHFLVEVVADSFSGLSRVARQRMIYNLLDEELKGRLHALSLKLFAPDEYTK